MLVLDSDHLSEIDRQSSVGRALGQRLRASRRQPVITIVSVEEQLRGWLAQVKRAQTGTALITAYERLQHKLETLPEWRMLAWNEVAAAEMAKLTALRLRLGTMDLRIASIVLAHQGATLLSRNLVDFARVPGLGVENWL